jgi:hypothetical protein
LTTVIHTPHGDVPAEPPELPPNAAIGAVCGELELFDAELCRIVAMIETLAANAAAERAMRDAEIGRALIEIDRLRWRVAALERQARRRPSRVRR